MSEEGQDSEKSRLGKTLISNNRRTVVITASSALARVAPLTSLIARPHRSAASASPRWVESNGSNAQPTDGTSGRHIDAERNRHRDLVEAQHP